MVDNFKIEQTHSNSYVTALEGSREYKVRNKVFMVIDWDNDK